jgi:DUF2075 family protein
MQLYAGSTSEFVHAATHNAIAHRLSEAFVAHFRHAPSPNEFQSWQNSLMALSSVIERADLNDNGILLEFQLPLTSRRLDALITGRDERRDRAVIVELKQWSKSELASAPELLRTWVGGDHREVLHPSVQANQYRRYLADMHEAFQGDAHVSLDACAFLHNYHRLDDDALFDPTSDAVRRIVPVFTGADSTRLAEHLGARLGKGGGEEVLQRVAQSRYRPAKKLLAHVSQVIRQDPAFILIDEQEVVFAQVRAAVDESLADHRKHVFLVHGGPGTGKSVLALNLLAEFSGRGLNAQHATGSKSFTSTLKRILGARAGEQFRYFNQFVRAGRNDIDVLVCDEAHRIRATSNHRYTRIDARSDRAQLEELVHSAKVTIFLVDDLQVVRPNEIGNSALIRQEAARLGCVLHESALEAQFRCAGSDAFVSWVDNTLAVRKTAHPVFDQSQEAFELGIVESPEALEKLIRDKAAQGQSARLVAGYCWHWSKALGADGGLVPDVRIGQFERPWNARPDMTGLPRGIPKADYWAHDPAGIDQVGCIYTAQGFEFDYVGVIWGKDLRYDHAEGKWVGDRSRSHDAPVKRAGDAFIDLVKNTYRVLLSRGLKGCYVYFEDPETEKFVRSRTEALGVVPRPRPASAPARAMSPLPMLDSRPFQVLRDRDARPWENCVPLLDLDIAAGDFGDAQSLEEDAVEWVALPDHVQARPGQFVAKVVGESMNLKVPNGAWALFSTDVAGSKQGKVVLARRKDLGDPEDGGRFVLKLYHADKVEGDDGVQYRSIELRPSSSDPRFKPLKLELNDDDRPLIVAVLVLTLV